MHRRRLLAALLLIPTQAPAGGARSSVERAAFQRANPCPATGLARGRCPGHEVDHIRPLCAGGADHRDNMAWRHTGEHKTKTRRDVGACRAARKGLATE